MGDAAPPSSPITTTGWPERGLVLGSTLALIETGLVHATGFAPVEDYLLIWVTDLVLCLAWGAALSIAVAAIGLLTRRRFSPHGRLRDVGMLLLPAILFAVRGNVDANQVNHPWAAPARWGVTLAVVVILLADLLFDRGHINEPMPVARFALASWLAGVSVMIGFASRTLDFTETLDVVVSDVFGRVGATLIALLLPLGALAARRRLPLARRVTAGRASAWSLGLFALASSLAVLLRAEPPRLAAPPPDAGAAGAGSQPSVLLVVMDTVRQDHVSAYGYLRRTTPNLDALAAGAIVFEGARAAATYSLSTHASLFTGLLPSAHGAHPIPPGAPLDAAQNPGSYRLRSSAHTLAEELNARGYLTAGISGNDVFLAAWTGLQRGFSQFACEARRSYGFVPTSAPILQRLGPTVRRAFPYHEEWPAEAITNGALAWTVETRGRPFFLFLNYYDAHAPYWPKPPYDRLFPAPSGDDAAVWMSQYDGEIAYVDASLKTLFEGLRQQGRFDDMLIVVTADHGEFFGEHSIFGHGDALYEPVLRVPLIVKLPRQDRGLRSAARVGQWQVRELVRRVVNGETDAEALAASLDAPGPKLMAESWNSPRGARNGALPAAVPRARAYYVGPFKYVDRVLEPDLLFHLTSDPLEESNYLVKDPELSRALKAQLRSLLAPEPTAGDLEVPDVDPAALERLRSMGYLGRAGRPSPR